MSKIRPRSHYLASVSRYIGASINEDVAGSSLDKQLLNDGPRRESPSRADQEESRRAIATPTPRPVVLQEKKAAASDVVKLLRYKRSLQEQYQLE